MKVLLNPSEAPRDAKCWRDANCWPTCQLARFQRYPASGLPPAPAHPCTTTANATTDDADSASAIAAYFIYFMKTPLLLRCPTLLGLTRCPASREMAPESCRMMPAPRKQSELFSWTSELDLKSAMNLSYRVSLVVDANPLSGYSLIRIRPSEPRSRIMNVAELPKGRKPYPFKSLNSF